MGDPSHATGQPVAKQLSGISGRVAENLQVSTPACAARPNQKDFSLQSSRAGTADALPPAGHHRHSALPSAPSFQRDESSSGPAHPSTEPLGIGHHSGCICSHPGSLPTLLRRRHVHTTASPRLKTSLPVSPDLVHKDIFLQHSWAPCDSPACFLVLCQLCICSACFLLSLAIPALLVTTAQLLGPLDPTTRWGPCGPNFPSLTRLTESPSPASAGPAAAPHLAALFSVMSSLMMERAALARPVAWWGYLERGVWLPAHRRLPALWGPL